MDEFEKACQELGIKLFVLPPRKPQYNGVVERSNRIFREELYANPKLTANSIGELCYELAKYTKKYNNYRPHNALENKTPNECKNDITRAA